MPSTRGVKGGWQPSGAANRNKRKAKLEKQAALLKKIPKMSMFAQPLSSQQQSGDNINLVNSSIENDDTRTQQQSGDNINQVDSSIENDDRRAQQQSRDNINLVDSSIDNDGTRTQQQSSDNINLVDSSIESDDTRTQQQSGDNINLVHSASIENKAKHGSCQPKGTIMTSEGNKIYTDLYYHREMKLFKVKRDWVAFSKIQGKAYCHHCWLFGLKTSKNIHSPWIDGFIPNTKHLQQQVRRHEESDFHKEAAKALSRCREGKDIEMLNADGMKKATNFWREVFRRLITIILTLATLCLPYRGHREMVGNGHCEGGNFLGLIKMQIDLGDSFLKELVEKPAGATKYLSPSIQNEIIKMLGDATRRNIVNKIKEAPCFSLIFDTTSDICRVDQISIIVRWVDSSTVSITETFIGFIVASDGGTAKALSKTVIAYLVSVGLNPLKIRGQGYDGATVMSGGKGGVNVIISDHLKENGVESPAPYVHCASHNLNLVVNDAAESNAQTITFFGVLEELYSFFNRSINRSADLKKLAKELGCITTTGEDTTLTLKRLCTTRWSSRIDTIRATKNRLGDAIQLLKGYIKDSKDKEKQEAQNLLKKISTLEFVILLNTWERILSSINLASKDLQAVHMDLGKSASELGRALNSVREMRGQWNEIRRESTVFALKVGIPVSSFTEKRTVRVRRFFDEEARDEPITDPEKKFRVEVFFKVIDTVISQLEERFKGQNFVAKTFNFLAPKNMLKMTASEVRCAANNLVSTYKSDLCSEFETPKDYAND